MPLVVVVFILPVIAFAIVFRKYGNTEAYAYDRRQPNIRFDSTRSVIEVPTEDGPLSIALKSATFQLGQSSELDHRTELRDFEGGVRTSFQTRHQVHLRIAGPDGAVSLYRSSSGKSGTSLVSKDSWSPLPSDVPT